MITFGKSEIQRIYYNNNDIIKVYAGDTQVWPDQDYLCLSMNTSTGSGNIAIALCPTTIITDAPSVEYSYDLQNWTSIDMTSWSDDKLSLSNSNNIILTPSRSKVYFKGNNPDGFNHRATAFDETQQVTATYFKINAESDDRYVEASGNVMSLLGQDITDIPNAYCFTGLFYGCHQLSTAPVLPAMNLTQECYGHMFEYCTALKQSPVLPAKSVPVMGYAYMFRNCSSLQQIECHAIEVEDENISTGGTLHWVEGVATSGDFRGTGTFRGWWNDNGIPSGWTFIEI